MINDERFADVPDLPQYGQLRAMCYASMPGGMRFAVYAIVGIVCFLIVGVVAGIAERKFADDPMMPGMIGAVLLPVLLIVGWLVARKLSRKCDQQALLVYDGGIHLNEDVAYFVSYGRWVEYCTGRRSVSLPWRVLSKFKAKEFKRKGQPGVQASLRLPDGRKMSISTADGQQSAVAIQTMLDHLG